MIRRCRNCKLITGDAEVCKPCWLQLTVYKRADITATLQWLDTHHEDPPAVRALEAAWNDAARHWGALAAGEVPCGW